MTKKIKKPAPRITKAQINKAAKLLPIKDMAKLASAYSKVGIEQDVELQMPLFCTIHTEDKGYRKGQIAAGVRLAPSRIYLGKKSGLIFVFETTYKVGSQHGDIQWCEVNWQDVQNYFGDFADQVEAMYEDSDPQSGTIEQMEDKLRGAVEKNPAMHSVLAKGFAKVQEDAHRFALQDDLEDNEIFGLF